MGKNNSETLGWAAIVVVVLGIVGVLLWGVPRYRVYNQRLRGEASLREAEWSRKIITEEAEARKLAEIARAEGAAEANRIIGESLRGNSEYLTYLWLQGLHDGNSEVIYVPTESQLPIIEAGRMISRPRD